MFTSDKLKKGAFYPLAEHWPTALRRFPLGIKVRDIMATWTGEKRAPRKGEWYLSGAKIEAYLAPYNMATPFHIARLAQVERTIQEVL